MDGIEESILWVTLLPEVGCPVRDQHRSVLALLEQEQELLRLARLRREDAQRAAQKLAEKVKTGGNWTDAEIEEAETGMGEGGGMTTTASKRDIIKFGSSPSLAMMVKLIAKFYCTTEERIQLAGFRLQARPIPGGSSMAINRQPVLWFASGAGGSYFRRKARGRRA